MRQKIAAAFMLLTLASCAPSEDGNAIRLNPVAPSTPLTAASLPATAGRPPRGERHDRRYRQPATSQQRDRQRDRQPILRGRNADGPLATLASHGSQNQVLTCVRKGATKDSISLSGNVEVKAASPQLPLNGYEGKWLPLMHIGGSSVSVDCDQAWRIRKRRRIMKRGFLDSPSFMVDVTINRLPRNVHVPVCHSR